MSLLSGHGLEVRLRRSRQRRAWGVTVLGVVLLTGCSGAGVEAPAPVASASASQTSEASATGAEATAATATAASALGPPQYPEAARHNDDAGQEAFIRYWFELYDYARTTGDTADLMSVTDRKFKGNQLMEREIADFYQGGSRLLGCETELHDMVRVAPDDRGVTSATVTIGNRAGTEVKPDGTSVAVPPEPPAAYSFVMEYKGGSWHARGLATI